MAHRAGVKPGNLPADAGEAAESGADGSDDFQKYSALAAGATKNLCCHAKKV
jgi:hypothetical protein